jgi:protein TilB
METKELNVNVSPTWVSIRIRGKLTQLRLSEEVIVSESKTERSQLTGMLTVTMKKLTPQSFIKPHNESE